MKSPHGSFETERASSRQADTNPVPAAPHPGDQSMPRWSSGELTAPPVFTSRNWFALLGPGLLAGGSAIGGGEWLMGPLVTAQYAGAMMWLATLSILGQVVYNIEISRYTLYCGEPIFTGKFRTLPGPRFWLPIYVLLDFGAFFPYLAASAATPVAAVWLGRIPTAEHHGLLRGLGIAIFLLAMVPLLVGGKIYNSLKLLMTFKVIVVLGFLFILAIFHSHASTWIEIMGGFVKFGNYPTASGQIANAFTEIRRGGALPAIDVAAIGQLAAFAAIAGMGGLTNTPISNYTRDQGWGMGRLVGAIPSVIGGHKLALSHVGTVFTVNAESLPRWRGWVRHVVRDQVVVWMPACFLGLALPSMLSIEFLPVGARGENWTVAGMTADGVASQVATTWGSAAGNSCWYLTLGCGFLVLASSMSTYADGFIRRWVDVFWTSSPRLRKWEPKRIRTLYFAVLMAYIVCGISMLSRGTPLALLNIATTIANFALGFSCWHTLVLNVVLLPPPLRPAWSMRLALFVAGAFFFALGTAALTAYFGVWK